jgi:hypothetical protein
MMLFPEFGVGQSFDFKSPMGIARRSREALPPAFAGRGGGVYPAVQHW